VYVAFNWGNGLYALDRGTGRIVWNMKKDYNTTHATPAVQGDVVFGAAEAFLYALDRMTGREIWRADAGGSWPISSPASAAAR